MHIENQHNILSSAERAAIQNAKNRESAEAEGRKAYFRVQEGASHMGYERETNKASKEIREIIERVWGKEKTN